MAANRLPASWMNALDPAAGARRSRWTAARAGAPRCPCISRRSRPASGQTLTVPSSFRRGELPRRLRAPFARNVIPGAHAADRARDRSRSQSRSWAALGRGPASGQCVSSRFYRGVIRFYESGCLPARAPRVGIRRGPERCYRAKASGRAGGSLAERHDAHQHGGARTRHPDVAALVEHALLGRKRCAPGTSRSSSALASVPSLDVLSGIDDLLDAPELLFRLAHERLHVDDPLTLLTGDLGPVVGVGGVGEVFVLLELLADGGEQVVGHDALRAAADVALEGELLGAAHDGLDHGAGREVLEVEDLFVAIGVGDFEEPVFFAQRVHGLDGRGDHGGDGAGDVGAPRLGFREGNVRREVLGEDVGGGAAVGALDLDLHVEPAGAQDGRVDEVLAVGGADDDDVLEAFDAVDLGQELGHDGGLDVGGDAGAAGAEQSVHLVEEDDDGHVLGGLFFGLDENLSNLSLGFSHVLVQQLRSFDVEEEALDLLAALLGDLFGEVVGDGLGDHGLAAAGGAVEEHALGRGELVLLVVVAVEVRELDGVLDGLDLIAEAADVLVADIGHFLEREVFDFALGKLLEQVAALRVEQEVIAGLEAHGAQGLGDDADLLFVGAQGDEGALGVELLLEDDDLALDLVAGGLDDVEALVEDELLAGLQVFGLDRGMEVDLHLAALGEDRDGVVLVGGEIHAVGRGRGAELVDLFLERGDLLARLVERVDELLVLIERLNELTVRLTQLVLEDHEVLRCVLELLPEVNGLGFERANVRLKVLHLDLVLREAATSARIRHRGGKELREALATGATLLVELLHSHPFSLDPLCAAHEHAFAVCPKYR